MVDAVIGTWEPVGENGLTDLLTGLGVDAEMTTRIVKTPHTVEYKRDGDNWHVVTTVPEKGVIRDVKLTLGVPYDSKTILREPCKSLVVQEGDKMVETQTGGALEFTITREMVGGELHVTMACKGKSGAMRYKKA